MATGEVYALTGGFSITPDDANDLSKMVRGIYVGGSGDLKVTMVNGDVVTFTSAPAGFLPIQVKRVWATGTDAMGLVGMT